MNKYIALDVFLEYDILLFIDALLKKLLWFSYYEGLNFDAPKILKTSRFRYF